MQRRVDQPGPLLNAQGRLMETGYATSLIRQYERANIKKSRLRVKEWDYYCVTSDRYALALTIADNGYMGLDSISLLDFDRPWEKTASKICALPLGRRNLPATSETGDVHVSGRGYEMTFQNSGSGRRLFGHMDDFKDGEPILFDLTLGRAPKDSMVIMTPFREDPQAFYYNQKINCLSVSGKAVLGGREYLFSPAQSFAVLDWGRGVWTYENTWYWGSASGRIGNDLFGFNLGYGFGDTSAASENMLFFNGAAHKLSQVKFEIPMKNGREDYLAPWRFTSDDGRFEMDFTPILDRAANMDFKLLCSDQHQVFGRFSGAAILDSGEAIRVRNMIGFAEKVHNKW